MDRRILHEKFDFSNRRADESLEESEISLQLPFHENCDFSDRRVEESREDYQIRIHPFFVKLSSELKVLNKVSRGAFIRYVSSLS